MCVTLRLMADLYVQYLEVNQIISELFPRFKDLLKLLTSIKLQCVTLMNCSSSSTISI